jgi:hypothetical protein
VPRGDLTSSRAGEGRRRRARHLLSPCRETPVETTLVGSMATPTQAFDTGITTLVRHLVIDVAARESKTSCADDTRFVSRMVIR